MSEQLAIRKKEVLDSMGIDLEHPSGEYHYEDYRKSVDTMDGSHEGFCRAPTRVNSLNLAINNKENTGPIVDERTLNNGNKTQTGGEININFLNGLEPRDGMEFESKEEAFSFYKEYGKSVGFAVVIKASRRSRVTGKFIDAKFACTRYGNKKESKVDETLEGITNTDGTTMFPTKRKRGRINRSSEKVDCKACMHAKRRQDGKWIVSTFIKDHNHEIFPDQEYYFRGHRNLDLDGSDADALNPTRARAKRMYVAMSRGGGYKRTVCQKGESNQPQGGQSLALDEGDVQIMLDHFINMKDENPNFFYAIDLNEEQRLRNFFWVDAKGRLDYSNFSDVVLFDITYIKNEYKLPFAPFIGVNHHCQFLLVGSTLLADETKSTYVWLMRTWCRAMGGHAPKVILTDQDKILKEAIAEVFPDTRHCFCLWHILNKIPEKLGQVIKQHEEFMTKFEKCIFKSWTGEQFEKRWWKIVERYKLSGDLWFQSIYEDRERWVPTYMKDIVLAGLSTTQRSESINCFLDKYMQRKTTLKEFLEQCRVFLEEKSEEEVKSDFESWHKQPALKSPSPFGKQMAGIYTHAVFKKFQVEVLGVVACHPKKEIEDRATKTFRVQDFEENQNFVVQWNETTSDISCLCRSFEFNGFLCRHVMIVLQLSGVHCIPSQCILKRWTKDAKSRQSLKEGSEKVESRVQRYNNICHRAFKLSDEGSLSQESYKIAFIALEEALRKCESANNSIQTTLEPRLPAWHGHPGVKEMVHINKTNNENKKNGKFKKGQVHLEPELISIGIHEGWQHMGHLNLRALAINCSFESQKSMLGLEQLHERAHTLEGYFGTQEVVEEMNQLNPTATNRDGDNSNQHNVQGLGQLSSIAPVHDTQYITQQRMHSMGLHFRSQSIQSCFDVHDNLQDMDQSNFGSTQLQDLEPKHLHSKHLSR